MPTLILLAKVAFSQIKISAKDAYKHINEKVIICDKVYSTKFISTYDMTLLNLGGFFPHQSLTIVIKSRDRKKFQNNPESDFNSKAICVTGVIVEYKGKPEIIVREPKQIQIE